MAQYRTAQGKVLDMGRFSAQNERVRAVGNMKVNARGDTIDSDGRVVQSVNDKINEYYTGTVANPGATSIAGTLPQSRPVESKAQRAPAAPQRGQQPAPQVAPAPPVAATHSMMTEMSAEELELEQSLQESLQDEINIERSKSKK